VGTDITNWADSLIGGSGTGVTTIWERGSVPTYSSGNRLRFGHMEVVGDPKIANPDKWGLMFNPAAFKFIPDSPYKVRTNPKSYPGVQGPGYKSLDLNVAKFFRVTERIQLEFKMEAYNFTSTFTGADPNTSVTSPAFGKVTAMVATVQGREMQYNMRIHF